MRITIVGAYDHSGQLYEQSAIDMASIALSDDFLDVSERADEVANQGVEFDRMTGPNTFRFQASAVTTEDQDTWEVMIRPDSFRQLLDQLEGRNFDKQNIENIIERGIEDGEVSVACDCPAFKWWGMEYIATQMDNIFGRGQSIAPEIRNPQEQGGGLCKHLVAVIMNLDSMLGDMAEGVMDEVDLEESILYKIQNGRDPNRVIREARKE